MVSRLIFHMHATSAEVFEAFHNHDTRLRWDKRWKVAIVIRTLGPFRSTSDVDGRGYSVCVRVLLPTIHHNSPQPQSTNLQAFSMSGVRRSAIAIATTAHRISFTLLDWAYVRDGSIGFAWTR